jgi:hypothetical protein
MTFVIADPEMMTASATDLSIIGSDLSTAHRAAAAQTVALVPAAADEVSVGIARLFSEHAHGFHALAAKASAFHTNFAQHLKAGAASYASADGPLGSLLPPGIRSLLIDTGRKLGLVQPPQPDIYPYVQASPGEAALFFLVFFVLPLLGLIAVAITLPVTAPFLAIVLIGQLTGLLP